MANGKVTIKEVYELVDSKVEKIIEKMDKHNEEIREVVQTHAVEIGKMKQTQTSVALFQMVLTTLASSVAAYLGIKSK